MVTNEHPSHEAAPPLLQHPFLLAQNRGSPLLRFRSPQAPLTASLQAPPHLLGQSPLARSGFEVASGVEGRGRLRWSCLWPREEVAWSAPHSD